jgi:hypothetical protein
MTMRDHPIYEDDKWGSDVPISMPLEPDEGNEAQRDFGGFGFGDGGLTHAMTADDRERIVTSFFGPRGGVNYSDEDQGG